MPTIMRVRESDGVAFEHTQTIWIVQSQ